MKLNNITAAVLIIGAILTVVVVVSVCKSSEAPGLAVWTVVPYAAFFASCRLARTRGRALATLVVSGLVTGLSVAACLNGTSHRDPNGGPEIGFVILPFLQLIPALILLAVVFFTRARNPPRA